MRYVFFGTPEFAAIILEKLIKAGFPPSAVVCNPDRPVGRKQAITPPLVKRLIASRKSQIEILQPENLGTIRDLLLALRPDFFIVAAYAKILPKAVIDLPRLGVIGVHPSLLPKYRGATPIQSAILNGETETGVTLFLIDEKVDHGPILANIKCQISNIKNYKELEKDLANLGANLLIETLPKFINGELKPRTQDESEATYTKKFVAEDGYVDPEDLRQAQDGVSLEKTQTIERRIRALNPEPGVYTIKNGKRIKLLEAEIKNGLLAIKKIQTEGKKPTIGPDLSGQF